MHLYAQRGEGTGIAHHGIPGASSLDCELLELFWFTVSPVFVGGRAYRDPGSSALPAAGQNTSLTSHYLSLGTLEGRDRAAHLPFASSCPQSWATELLSKGPEGLLSLSVHFVVPPVIG